MSSNKGKNKDKKDSLFAFNFRLPSEGLALRSVAIENGIPRLIFDPALKVPTLTEEDIGIACRLACEETRPEFFYYAFPPHHPYYGRQYMHHSPAWLRGTSVGELLAEADWTMKCLNIGARSDEKKEKFWAWQETSNLVGLANILDFPRDNSPGSVIMSCKSVEVKKSENEMIFIGEPKIQIKADSNSTYTKYITEIFPSIAYHDEPLFLKVQELIKLILAAEWLKEKKVRFNRPWMMECSTSKKKEASRAVKVKSQIMKENEDAITKVEKQLWEATHLEITTKSGLTELKISVDKTITESGIEASINHSFQPSSFPVKFEETTTVRASVHDHDMVYKDLDPNMPVCKSVIPKVQSWSELFSQTVPWPRVWLLPFEGVELQTASGGVSTSTIPVRATAPTCMSSQVKVQSRVPVSEPVRQEQYEACNGQLHVHAQQGGSNTRKRVPNRMVPRQTTVTRPKNDVISETNQTLLNRSAEKRGAKRAYGYVDARSGEGVVYNERGELIKREPGLRQCTCIQERVTVEPTQHPASLSQQQAAQPIGAATNGGSVSPSSSVSTQPKLAPLTPTQRQVRQPARAGTNDLLSPTSSVSSLDSGIASLPGAQQSHPLVPQPQQQVRQPARAGTNDLLSPASSVSSLDSGISSISGAHPMNQQPHPLALQHQAVQTSPTSTISSEDSGFASLAGAQQPQGMEGGFPDTGRDSGDDSNTTVDREMEQG